MSARADGRPSERSPRAPSSRPGDPGAGRGTGGVLLRVLLCLGILGAAGCSAASPPDGLDWVERFDWAVERFEAGEMGSARKGLRDFLLNEPLHPMADSAQYLLGETLYRSGRHVEAAEAFSRLATNRPTSKFADDAQFGVCRSYWALSPDLALEQSYTRDAVDACSRVIEFYSPSPLEDDAREVRQKARDKLAAKWYRIARWYFDHGAYESANIYLEDILEEYGEASVVPEVLAMLFRSYRELGFDSEARQVRQRLMENHPETESARSLEGEEIAGST